MYSFFCHRPWSRLCLTKPWAIINNSCKTGRRTLKWWKECSAARFSLSLATAPSKCMRCAQELEVSFVWATLPIHFVNSYSMNPGDAAVLGDNARGSTRLPTNQRAAVQHCTDPGTPDTMKTKESSTTFWWYNSAQWREQERVYRVIKGNLT